MRTIFRLPLRLVISAAVTMGAMFGLAAQAADPLVFVSGNGPEIISFTLTGGKLSEVARSPAGKNPSYLAWSPNNQHLYAINDGAKVLSFAIDAAGKLTQTGEGSMGAAGNAAHISVNPSGKWLYTASYGSGHVTVLPVKDDGSVGNAVDVQMAGVKAHQAVVNQDGSVLLVPTLGLDQVQVYRIDSISGKLTHSGSIPLAKGAGPRHCAWSHDEKHLYVINELDSTITTFRNDGLQFKLLGTVPTLPADFTTKNTCAHIVVSPDGKTIYGSNRGHNSLAIFRVSDDGATLTPAGHETAGGEINIPRNFSLSPDGLFALVGSQKSELVTVLSINPATGHLTKVGTQPLGIRPSFVGVMPR